MFKGLFLLTTAVATLSASSSSVATPLVDRLLVEINLATYSQSELELYLLCKDVLSGDGERSLGTAENWDKFLEEFKNDMVIHQESARLGSFEATPQVLERAKEVFGQRRQQVASVEAHLQRLGPSERLLNRMISTSVSVEAFKRSKKRQAAVLVDTNDNAQLSSNFVPQWHQDLIQRSVVRYFDNAFSFRGIRFSP